MLQLGYCFIAARLSQDIDVFGPVGAVGLPGLQAMYADTRLSHIPRISGVVILYCRDNTHIAYRDTARRYLVTQEARSVSHITHLGKLTVMPWLNSWNSVKLHLGGQPTDTKSTNPTGSVHIVPFL